MVLGGCRSFHVLVTILQLKGSMGLTYKPFTEVLS